jgi:hypothetical protein
MADYAACIVGTRFLKQFDGDLHEVVLSFRGIVRSFKSLAEMTATVNQNDRPHAKPQS